jgi:DNA sulfur modification protein DndB
MENVLPTEDLTTYARAAAKPYAQKSVHSKLVQDATSEGWTVIREGKASTRLKRDKAHGLQLEDRVWTLFYRMGFDAMSGKGGATLRLNPKDSSSPSNQIDVVAVDADVCLTVECKSSAAFAKRPQFMQELAKFSEMRERIARSIAAGWPGAHKRHSVMAFFTNNIQLSDTDKERAKASNIVLLDEVDLAYYEKLVAHLGPAAKYQMYSDMLPGKSISGLSMRVPAVKIKMGPYSCYTFPVSPDYLLKIAYVSHRSKGKASDIHTYQRMVTKTRLKAISEYISDHGIFPTNIVVNIEKKSLTFHRIKQENASEDQAMSGTLGWLDLKPAYKSAWIIDGQHRLFAYSGHPFAKTGHVTVLAFEGIPTSDQAKLFIDINAKQKSVKPSLLQELFAELHWNADSPATRVQAIISKTVQVLGADKASPFYERIQTADSLRDSIRCISLTTLYKAIGPEFFLTKVIKDEVIEGGVFWRVNNQDTLVRAVAVVRSWFNTMRMGASDWWDLGAKEGGGFAMNDSVTACMMTLRSVIQYLDLKGSRLIQLDNEDLIETLRPYADVLASHFGQMSEDDRKRYRDLRGSQGQTARMRRAQQALNVSFPSFNPPGLTDFLLREKEQTNLQAKTIIDRIERALQKLVIQELRQEYNEEWWVLGVPKSVRVEVTKRSETDDNKRGSREAYFDLIDYRTIAASQWSLFQKVMSQGKKSESKEKQTKWLQDVNEMRNVVSHASSGISLSIEQVATLEGYERQLAEMSGLPDDVLLVEDEES